MNNEKHKIMRIGKTAKDKARRIQERNTENKQTRADWENDRAPSGNPTTFPIETCNGKKNRYSKSQKKAA